MTEWSAEFDSILRNHLPLLGAQPLRPTDRLADLGLDSLSTVSLLLELEETFGIAIPDEMLTAETFATAASLWAVVGAPQPQMQS